MSRRSQAEFMKSLEKHDSEVRRALKYLEPATKEQAIALLCNWLGTTRMKQMNDFWESRGTQKGEARE